MKRNLITFIAFSAFLTVGSVVCYGQVTINQPASIAELMELKKEVARNESAYQVQCTMGTSTMRTACFWSLKTHKRISLYP